jgi:hypothetical protein
MSTQLLSRHIAAPPTHTKPARQRISKGTASSSSKTPPRRASTNTQPQPLSLSSPSPSTSVRSLSTPPSPISSPRCGTPQPPLRDNAYPFTFLVVPPPQRMKDTLPKVLASINQSLVNRPLPTGWTPRRCGATGLVYYTYLPSRHTQWTDPRSPLAAAEDEFEVIDDNDDNGGGGKPEGSDDGDDITVTVRCRGGANDDTRGRNASTADTTDTAAIVAIASTAAERVTESVEWFEARDVRTLRPVFVLQAGATVTICGNDDDRHDDAAAATVTSAATANNATSSSSTSSVNVHPPPHFDGTPAAVVTLQMATAAVPVTTEPTSEATAAAAVTAVRVRSPLHIPRAVLQATPASPATATTTSTATTMTTTSMLFTYTDPRAVDEAQRMSHCALPLPGKQHVLFLALHTHFFIFFRVSCLSLLVSTSSFSLLCSPIYQAGGTLASVATVLFTSPTTCTASLIGRTHDDHCRR